MTTATGSPRYQVLPGPEGLLPPSAAAMGVVLPQDGEGLVEGVLVSEAATYKAIAKAMLTRRNPTIVTVYELAQALSVTPVVLLTP